jgi:predicted hydrocarbon binding protein
MKYKTEAEFLQAELKRTVKNNRLELKDKNTLIQYYTPREMKSNERCFCSLMKNLPEGINASPTYCQCSRGFVEKYWETALGRPIKVDVIATALTGADECKFVIYL